MLSKHSTTELNVQPQKSLLESHLKQHSQPAGAAHTPFNCGTREAEAGGSLEFEASLVYRVPGQPAEVHSETLSQKTNQPNKQTKQHSQGVDMAQ